jgi:uncharacterized protein (TIGR02147 family)
MNVFSCDDYRSYLRVLLSGRGAKSRFANAISCNPAYLTNILKENADLSLEQGEAANTYFHHDEEESEYFLLLINFQKAGTEALKNRLRKRLIVLKERALNLKYRLNVQGNELTLDETATYYSSWIFGAVHAAISVAKINTVKKVSTRLSLPEEKVVKVISFLIDAKIIEEKESGVGWQPSKRKIHLDSTSPFISLHHSNWRNKALDSIGKGSSSDLHYSSVISISNDDFFEIRNKLIEAIKNSKLIISDSKDEDVFSLCIDLFKV